MQRTITYESRPPKSARAARRAWDYCAARFRTARRDIQDLCFSPNCDHAGPRWLCTMQGLDSDLDNWGFRPMDLVMEVPPAHVAEWIAEGRPKIGKLIVNQG